jgi:16S rRNA processing protein RimM
MVQSRLIVIGQVVKAFGVRGEINIRPFTESIGTFQRSAVLFFGDSSYEVLRVRSHKGNVLALVAGIDTPEKAEHLRGSLVKTHEENLPPKEEDEYFWFELIGMSVLTVDGRDLGRIAGIMPTGANDVIQVEGAYGEILLPMIEDVVVEIDTGKGVMIVDPLEGLVPDA